MQAPNQSTGEQTKHFSTTSIEQRSATLQEYAMSLGAELYGVASAKLYEERFPDKPNPTQLLESAHSIVIIGLPFEPGTMATVLRPELAGLRSEAADQVSGRAVHALGAERFFLEEENEIINHELTLMGYKIAKYLRKQGYNALHLPPGKQDDRFRTAPFYHMPAMYLAGMGTLGWNCAILTPQFGPRIYVTSIITDCSLATGQPLEEELCLRCGTCVKNCPIQAIDGEGWKNPYACASYGCCSTCIAICPVGEV